MPAKPRLRLAALAAMFALSAAAAPAQELVAPPDDGEAVVNVAPAPADACYRFGVRAWAKRTLFDKSGACRCVKCGWHVSPPRRICWRVC